MTRLFESRTDWRWRYVTRLLAQQPPSLRRAVQADDLATQAAAFFKRDYDRGLGWNHPEHEAAASLRFTEPQLRIGLEGSLLCDKDDGEIEQIMAIPAEVVRTYHDLFFDVRPRLHNYGWISAAVFGGMPHAGASASGTRDNALRIAWMGGWTMFEPLIRGGLYDEEELETAKRLMMNVSVRRAAEMLFTAGNYPGSMEYINSVSSISKLMDGEGDSEDPAAALGAEAIARFAEAVGQHSDGRRLCVVADVADDTNIEQPAREKRAEEYEVLTND